MKKLAILGSTGSIGRATLDVVRHLSHEMQVVALAAYSNLDLLEQQAKEFQPLIVAMGDPNRAVELQKRLPGIRVAAGVEGLCEAAAWKSADLVVLAMSGIAGLKPAFAAIEAGKRIALANKEILVCAGELVMHYAKEKKVDVLPIDSEHSAIFQCLQGSKQTVRRLILTASGGPFRKYSQEALAHVNPEMALKHPNFQMGSKITVDSSTLMNKGLEMIEAKHLFGIEAIEVITHPQQIIHSMVEYCDGSILAQMSEPTMVVPIQYALTHPQRQQGVLEPFDFLKHSQLTFEQPDRNRFPCLRLAEEALHAGRSFPAFLNAANEILVYRFLSGEISWVDIAAKLEKLISFHQAVDVLTLEAVLAVDREAREKARTY